MDYLSPINSDKDIITREYLDTTPIDVSSNYTLSDANHRKWIRASGTITITLPDGIRNYFECIVQNVSTGTIIISGLDESLANQLTTLYSVCTLYYNGTSWVGVGFSEITAVQKYSTIIALGG